MLKNINFRLLCGFCLLICLASLVGAAYLQYVAGLQPCSMCILQRWIFIGLTLVLIIAFLQNPQHLGQRLYGVSIILLSTVGSIIAGRQVWLQHLPPEARPECGPGFDFLMQNFPMMEAFHYIFSGSGECAIIDWTFLGQSLAVWSLVLFIILILLGLWTTIGVNKRG
jgi:disulfide bond formation protein DsbB